LRDEEGDLEELTVSVDYKYEVGLAVMGRRRKMDGMRPFLSKSRQETEAVGGEARGKESSSTKRKEFRLAPFTAIFSLSCPF